MLLNRLYIISLADCACHDRRLPGRRRNLYVHHVIQTVRTRFRHGIQRVAKFVLVNVDALLPRLLQLLKDALGPVQLFRFAFQFYPPVAGRDFHAKRVFKCFQKFEIVCVKRLHHPRALELQRAGVSHCKGGARAGYDTASSAELSKSGSR